MKTVTVIIVIFAALSVFAQEASSTGLLNRRRAASANTTANAPANENTDEEPAEASSLNWDGATEDLILAAYGDACGRTILRDPGVPKATITLKSRKGEVLTKEEYLTAIETVLEMNGIHLEPFGEKFIRALPRAKVRKEGIPVITDSETVLKDSNRVVSMMIPFKNIAIEEAKTALENLKSETAVLNVYERINSILVTDTEQNINRMLEIVRQIDIASPITENVFIYQVENASAIEIQQHLQKIVEESMKEQEKNGKGVNNAAQNNAASVQPRRLLSKKEPEAPTPPADMSSITAMSDADRGVIRGKVLILADERSNKLVIVTSKANYDFFEKVIRQLDVETTPDTVVKVYRLKYADAEEVSDMINDLIGNASSSKNSSKANQNQAAKGQGGGQRVSGNNASQTAKSANQRTGDAKAGELSKENTTVLADKRINGLVVMTAKDLVPVVEQIIEAMDVKLAQVLIETCIIEVNLEDEIATGVDWVHKIRKDAQAISGGGGSTSSGGTLADIATDVAVNSIPAGSGLNYLLLSDKLDLGLVIEASKTDSRTKYVASPVIMTVDNKEATIEATQMRYLLTGFTSSGTSYSTIAVPNYEQKELGITIKTTPKINPNGTVMLEIEEEYSQLGAAQSIQTAGGLGTSGGGTNNTGLITVNVDTTVTRKLSADISLENRQTVVLGGLTETKVSRVDTGIPILKDIPWIGRYLFGKTVDKENRKELLVFMTPYVLDDGEMAQAKARQLKNTLSDSNSWDDHGWSESPLADPISTKEKLRRQRDEWARQDQEYAAELELEKAKGERVKELEKKAEQRSLERAKEAAAIAEEFNRAQAERAEARAEAEAEARENNKLLQSLQEETGE